MGNRERIPPADQALIKATCLRKDIFACSDYDWLSKLSLNSLESFVRIISQTDAHNVVCKRPDRLAGTCDLILETKNKKSKESFVDAITTFLERNKSKQGADENNPLISLKQNKPEKFNETMKQTSARVQTLTIIDISFIVFASFHAPERRATDDERFAIFLKMLHDIIYGLRPANLAICFDSPVNLKKREKFEWYKANRTGDVDMAAHFERAKEFVKACRIPHFRQDGFEADDLVNALKTRWLAMDATHHVAVVTSDKDFFQICSARVFIFKYQTKDKMYHLYQPADVHTAFGIRPDQFVDLQCLMGDSSDRVIGLEGVGHKTALKLLQEHDNLQRIFQYAAMVRDQTLLAQQHRILHQNKEVLTFLNPRLNLDSRDDVVFVMEKYKRFFDQFLAVQSVDVQEQFKQRFAKAKSTDAPF